MSDKFTLPISPSYVAHWGLWEAVRELYQNALDEHTRDQGCVAEIFYVNEQLIVCTSSGKLEPSTLVLGNGDKSDNQSMRGKYGEGYKLALLVLARLGFGVDVLNGSDCWIPKIEHNEEFCSDVLAIYVDRGAAPYDMEGTGVRFEISGVSSEQWEDIQRNIRKDDADVILENPEESGRIYVGGLYVCTMKEFRCGYSFQPERIKLDRDRSMVSTFDLAWETSLLWSRTGDAKRISELLEKEAPDVEYLANHAGSSLALSMYAGFVAEHGHEAVPVSTQEEVERAAKSGVKWVLVKSSLKSILHMVRGFFIPEEKSPLDRLVDFKTKWQYKMNAQMHAEIDEIIESMGGVVKKETAEEIPF